MKVIFSNRAYASVLAETTEKIQTETGGLFLGTIQNDTWYIIEAIDPGPKSIFEIAYFEYDKQYTQHLINKIANLYDEKLDLIGLWHRHPGSFDRFSSTDNGTNAKYAAMRGQGAISALVNIDPNFRITMYHVGQPCKYNRIAYEVGDQLIPEAFLKFKSPSRFFHIMDDLLHPATTAPGTDSGYHKSVSLSSFMKFILPQLEPFEQPDDKDDDVSLPEGELPSRDQLLEKLIDEVIDDLSFMADALGIETALSDTAHNALTVYQETIDKTEELTFTYNTAESAFTFLYNETYYIYHTGLFAEAFGKAKLQKEKEKASAKPGRRIRTGARTGIVDSVIKIIKPTRNEE